MISSGFADELKETVFYPLVTGRDTGTGLGLTIAQDLVDKGVLPAERMDLSPYRNVLASAIGGGEATPEVTCIRMVRSGTLMFCTDGLTKHVTDEEIGERMARMTVCSRVGDELLCFRKRCVERIMFSSISILCSS